MFNFRIWANIFHNTNKFIEDMHFGPDVSQITPCDTPFVFQLKILPCHHIECKMAPSLIPVGAHARRFTFNKNMLFLNHRAHSDQHGWWYKCYRILCVGKFQHGIHIRTTNAIKYTKTGSRRELFRFSKNQREIRWSDYVDHLNRISGKKYYTHWRNSYIYPTSPSLLMLASLPKKRMMI